MATSYCRVKRFIPYYGEPVGINLATGLRGGRLGICSASMQMSAGSVANNRVFSIPTDHSNNDLLENDSNIHGSPYKRSIQILKGVVDMEVSASSAEGNAGDDGAMVEIILSHAVPAQPGPGFNTTGTYSFTSCCFFHGNRVSFEIDPKFLPTFVENAGETTVCHVSVVAPPGVVVTDLVEVNVHFVYTEVALQDQRV